MSEKQPRKYYWYLIQQEDLTLSPAILDCEPWLILPFSKIINWKEISFAEYSSLTTAW